LFKTLNEKSETTIKAIKEILILKALTLPQQPAPDQQVYPAKETAPLSTSRETGQLMTELVEIATAYSKRFTTKPKEADTTF
jgi:hypothetical protein